MKYLYVFACCLLVAAIVADLWGKRYYSNRKNKMSSSTPGAPTSRAEVTNIDGFGLWVLIDDREYFLPYVDFPWFRGATLGQILNLQLLHDDHLYWPDLDVDLSLDILTRPEAFPLIDG